MEIESVWCKVKLSNIEIVIRAIYRPPKFSFDFLEKLKEVLVKTRVNTRNVIISRDFNVPSIDWDTLTPENQDITLHSTVIDMTSSHGLPRIVKSYTRAQGEC